MDPDEEQIEENEMEEEEDRNGVLALAEMEKEEHNQTPDIKLKIDIVGCARNEDTVHFSTAPGYQISSPEVTMPNPCPKNYVRHAYPLLEISRIVHIASLITTPDGHASKPR